MRPTVQAASPHDKSYTYTIRNVTDWTWIGEELKARREALGRNQRWVAERAEITQAQLSLIERGRSLPPLTTLERVAGVLGLEVRLTLAGAGDVSSRLDVSHLPQRSRALVRDLVAQLDPANEEFDE